MQASVQQETCGKVAVIVIAVGTKYLRYFRRYYRNNRKNLLPQADKTYFVITDQAADPLFAGMEGIVPVSVGRTDWPFPTLFRFKYIMKIADQLADYSRVIYLDTDMKVVSPISEEEFLYHGKPLFGVEHPLYIGFPGTFETNPQSLACVGALDDLSTYWQGCFWGGLTKDVLQLCAELEMRIDNDLSRGVIACWHDESHLNKYFIEHKSQIHTYHPGYAYPQPLKIAFEKKIMHIDKRNLWSIARWRINRLLIKLNKKGANQENRTLVS
jgi:hypothetical protein